MVLPMYAFRSDKCTKSCKEIPRKENVRALGASNENKAKFTQGIILNNLLDIEILRIQIHGNFGIVLISLKITMVLVR